MVYCDSSVAYDLFHVREKQSLFWICAFFHKLLHPIDWWALCASVNIDTLSYGHWIGISLSLYIYVNKTMLVTTQCNSSICEHFAIVFVIIELQKAFNQYMEIVCHFAHFQWVHMSLFVYISKSFLLGCIFAHRLTKQLFQRKPKTKQSAYIFCIVTFRCGEHKTGSFFPFLVHVKSEFVNRMKERETEEKNGQATQKRRSAN